MRSPSLGKLVKFNQDRQTAARNKPKFDLFFDGAGSVASSSGDTTAPTIEFVDPTSNQTYLATADDYAFIGIIEGACDDNVAVTSVTWANDRGGSGSAAIGGGAWQIMEGVTLYSGVNVITVTAHDAAGNTAAAVLTVTSPPDLWLARQSLAAFWNFTTINGSQEDPPVYCLDEIIQSAAAAYNGFGFLSQGTFGIADPGVFVNDTGGPTIMAFPDFSFPETTQPFTVHAYVYLAAIPEYTFYPVFSGDETFDIYAYYDAAANRYKLRFTDTFTTWDIVSTPPGGKFDTDAWFSLIFTFDGVNGWSFYYKQFNSGLTATLSVTTAPIINSPSGMYFAASHQDLNTSSAIIDSMGIWSRVISASEIAYLQGIDGTLFYNVVAQRFES